jgi:ubiquinone/menaquinone biosynthesis C-methylase UbiE
MGMEGGTARWYDRTTRRDLPEYQALAARIAAQVPAQGDVLEVAPGPGFLSIEMAKRGLQVRAVDISRTFVEIASRNAAEQGVAVQFLHGNAAALPVADASVDFVVCRAAFKNFTEPVKAMREMRRVLRPGGTALLIDMCREAKMRDLMPYVRRQSTGWVERRFIAFVFRLLIWRAYPLRVIRRMTEEAGWTQTEITVAGSGFEASMKKL